MTVHNDGTGTQKRSNYDCVVSVTVTSKAVKRIAHARVTGHDRSQDWRTLIQKVVDSAVDE